MLKYKNKMDDFTLFNIALDTVEIWRPIPHYSKYEVSTCGRVRSTKKILSPFTTRNGYKRISIVSDNGEKNNVLIHRCVLMAFVNNPENLSSVDHIDGNRLNNAASNLRWASNSQNQYNRKINHEATHKFDGLFFSETTKKWVVNISMGGGVRFARCYDNFAEALAVRNEKKKQAAGEFATFIDISKINTSKLPQATPFIRARYLSEEKRKERQNAQQRIYKLEKVTCVCGAIVCRASLNPHIKTAKHVRNLAALPAE